MRVLVIEDDPMIADMLLMVVEVEGFSVDVAADGGRTTLLRLRRID